MVPLRYRRYPWVFALVVLAVALGVVDRLGWLRAGRPAGGDYERYDQRVATVLHVVDGDTLDIDIPDGARRRTRIRLWGVDTPETGAGEREEMYFGPESSAYAQRTMLHRLVRVELSPVRTRDKYGRLLAYVYLVDTGEMFNELLIRTGHGYADRRFDHAYERRFERLEKEAQAAAIGLWEHVTFEDFPGWRLLARNQPAGHNDQVSGGKRAFRRRVPYTNQE